MPRNQDEKLCDIEIEVKHETSKAWLLYDGKDKVWIAKSQCENNGDGTFTMPEWLAKEKGFI